MRYPRLGSVSALLTWANRLCEQLERDWATSGAGGGGAGLYGSGRIIKPAMSSNAVTLDLAIGDIFIVTLDDNLDTITVSHPPATDRAARSFMVIFVQDTGGGNTVAFPAGWLWSEEPTITATGDAISRIQVDLIDSTYYADVRELDYL